MVILARGAGAASGAAEIIQLEPDQDNTCDREPLSQLASCCTMIRWNVMGSSCVTFKLFVSMYLVLNAMEMPRRYHGIAMAMPWQCHGIAMAVPWHCHCHAMGVPRQCHGSVMTVPWQCHGIAMAVPLQCQGSAMVLPWQCHGSAMQFHGSLMTVP